jgi:hypothetical protein
MRRNKLKNLEGIQNMPNLTEFYCAENEITTFEHITNVP